MGIRLRRIAMKRVFFLAAGLALSTASAVLSAAEDPYPRYKPSTRSPEPIDIRTNAYGASRSAPNALEIGARAPDFTVPRAGGGTVSLRDAHQDGPVVIIFYRGHW